MKRGITVVESNLAWLQRVIDALIPLTTLYIISLFSSISWHDRYLLMGTVGGAAFIICAQTIGSYQNWCNNQSHSCLSQIFKAWLFTWVLLIVLAFLFKDSSDFSRVTLVTWGIFTPLLLLLYRFIIKSFLSRTRTSTNTRQIAIAGAGKLGAHLGSIIVKNKWLGLNLVAYFDDNSALHNTHVNGISIIGSLDKITISANNKLFDELYICLPLRAELRIKKLLNQLTDSTAIVKFVPDFFTFDLMHAKWTEISGIPIISIFDTPLGSWTAQLFKRLEDIIISALIILLISPFLVLISVGIKTSSSGPILFKQKRYGLNGKEINVYKFRTMTTQDNGSTIQQATKNDVRITKFGALLRKTSLDELPQFFNVLQGRMSIVGPRPHAVAHNEEYRKLVPKYMQRHLVKPGITGWAQINGWRGETDTLEKMEKRIEFDIHYIKNWTLWLDLKIILLTIFKGFIHKNAY